MTPIAEYILISARRLPYQEGKALTYSSSGGHPSTFSDKLLIV
jgi:hypothetical protein